MSADMIRLPAQPFGPLASRPSSPAGSAGPAAAPDEAATRPLPVFAGPMGRERGRVRAAAGQGPARASGLAGSRHDQPGRRTARPEQHHHCLHRNHHRARHRRRLLGPAGRGAGRGQAGVGAPCRTRPLSPLVGEKAISAPWLQPSARHRKRGGSCCKSTARPGPPHQQNLRLGPAGPRPRSCVFSHKGRGAARLPAPPDRAAAFGGARTFDDPGFGQVPESECCPGPNSDTPSCPLIPKNLPRQSPDLDAETSPGGLSAFGRSHHVGQLLAAHHI